VIVVCGNLEATGRHGGLVVAIAGRAATVGAIVQVIGIIGDGTDGDRQLLALAAAGIGHAAVLRTAPRALEVADVELALRYLPDIRVVISAGASPSLTSGLADGAAYAGATFILVDDGNQESSADGFAESAIVLEAPPNDPDGTFAGFVGAFAARLDAGAVPADAWEATIRDLAVDAVTPGPGRRGRASAS
jgi:hypothetical protein